MKLYIASDIRHAKRWITFREKCYPQITVVSSWIDFLKNGEPAGLPEHIIEQAWDNNITDIALCEMLLLYHEAGDRMRGVLFEAGIAFALKKQIIFVGDESVLGTVRVCFQCAPSMDVVVKALYEHNLACTPEGTVN